MPMLRARPLDARAGRQAVRLLGPATAIKHETDFAHVDRLAAEYTIEQWCQVNTHFRPYVEDWPSQARWVPVIIYRRVAIVIKKRSLVTPSDEHGLHRAEHHSDERAQRLRLI